MFYRFKTHINKNISLYGYFYNQLQRGMNYLVEFIEDSKNGITKDEIQKKRASEVYDHYTQDLHGNSYIHDGWDKYVK